MSKCWYTIRSADGIDGEILLYGEIGLDVSAASFERDLQQAFRVGAENVALRVNSRGGDYFEAVTIFNSIRKLNANVVAYIDGIAASAASYIVMAASKIVMYPNSGIRPHNPFATVTGDAEMFAQFAADLAEVRSIMAGEYARKAGMTVEQALDIMGRDALIGAQQAVDMGLADEIAESAPNTMTAQNETAIMAQDLTPEESIGEDEVETYTKEQLDSAVEAAVAKISAEYDEKIRSQVSEASENAKIAERARIKDIEAVAISGYDEIISGAKFGDGDAAISAEQVAVQILSLEKQKGAKILASLAESDQKIGDIAPAAKEEKKDDAKAAWDSSESIRAQYAEFEDFKANWDYEHRIQ